MATVKFAETLDNSQDSTWLTCISCSLLDLNRSKLPSLLLKLLNYLILQVIISTSLSSSIHFLSLHSSLLFCSDQEGGRALPGSLLTIRCFPSLKKESVLHFSSIIFIFAFALLLTLISLFDFKVLNVDKYKWRIGGTCQTIKISDRLIP
jgi:hypothetical protein